MEETDNYNFHTFSPDKESDILPLCGNENVCEFVNTLLNTNVTDLHNLEMIKEGSFYIESEEQGYFTETLDILEEIGINERKHALIEFKKAYQGANKKELLEVISELLDIHG